MSKPIDIPNESHTKWKLLEILPQGLRLLTESERRWAILLSLLVSLTEVVQVVAMLLVLPVVGIVVEPDLLQSHRAMQLLHEVLGSLPVEQFVFLLSVTALFCIAVGQIGNLIAQSAIELFVSRIQTRLAHELLRETIAAPYPWFLERNTAQLVRLFHNDIAVWGRDCIGNMLRVLTYGLTILAGVIVVLSTAPVGGVIALAMVAVLACGILWIIRPSLIKWTNTKRQAADHTMIIETQILSGVKDIKVNSGGGHFLHLFKDAYGLMSHASARGVILGQLPASLLLLVGQSSLLFAVLILWKSGLRGGEIASQMALILLVTSRVVPATTRLSGTITSLFNALPWVEGILVLRHSIQESSRTLAPVGGITSIPLDWRHIRFAKVSFYYAGADKPVLADLSVELERGRFYGLIGASGAGKSTFVDLLLGLLQPRNGQILVDSIPLAEIDLHQWQRRIGYVSQVPYFTDDSIRANIAFGVTPKSVDEVRIQHCVAMSGLESFIADVPQGLDARLGDRAVKISGGQRQRIAIARALYKQPDILLLDEATASLDPDTQKTVLQTIENLRGHVTTLIISHQLSVVASCDHVFVLEGGQVAAKGGFGEIAHCPTIGSAARQE